MRSRSSHRFGLALLLALLPGGLPLARAAEPTAAEAEFFENEVRPLLVEKCWECHGETKHKGRLKLTSRANSLQGRRQRAGRRPQQTRGKPFG